MSAETVLCIAGSPRRNGNSDRLLAEAIRGAHDAGLTVDHLVLEPLHFSGCTECGGCAREGRCTVPDDMQSIFSSIDRADHIIISTPVFFMGLPSKLKAVIDRCQLYWARHFVRHQPIGRFHPGGNVSLIAAGASASENLFSEPRRVTRSLCVVLELKYKDQLFVPDLEGPSDILQHPDFLQRAYHLGLTISLPPASTS